LSPAHALIGGSSMDVEKIFFLQCAVIFTFFEKIADVKAEIDTKFKSKKHL
jgi:hypothetical protein